MAVTIYDIVSGNTPATLSAHLTDKPLQEPFVLDQLGEVSWTTYAPSAIDDMTRNLNSTVGMASIVGNVKFWFQGPEPKTKVSALYVVGQIGTDRYLLYAWDLNELGLTDIVVGVASYTVTVVAAASNAEHPHAL
jgi:hypothetical protein